MYLDIFTCPNGLFFSLTRDALIIPDFVLFQASMTGSALSLYLEETKTNDDSMFQSEISPIKREGLHSDANNKSNLNMSTGARDVPSRGRGDPSDILSPTPLALHKVVEGCSDQSATECYQLIFILNTPNHSVCLQ